MSKPDANMLDKIKFVPIKELLLPDSDKIKEMKSIYGIEFKYLNFLGSIEFFIANYGLTNLKLKDIEIVKALRNIRNNLDKNIDFFRSDLEYNLMMIINASLQTNKKITKHELLLVIKHILWAIDNRTWMGNRRAYLEWIANFFHLLNKGQKEEFDESYEKLAKKYGFDDEKIKNLKGDNLDYESPLSEVALAKIDSENFDEDEDGLWSDGEYMRSIDMKDPETIKKLKYFKEDPNESKDFECSKCKNAIGKHNLYWHEEMCDDCFHDIYHSKLKK